MQGGDLILQRRKVRALKKQRPDLAVPAGWYRPGVHVWWGYDNAIELAFMPSGETIGTMTYFINPQGGMRDALMHWLKEACIQNLWMSSGGSLQIDRRPHAGNDENGPCCSFRCDAVPWIGFGKEFNGNLFTAEFNTGRVMRYRITLKVLRTVLLTNHLSRQQSSDIHLTDVLEDADGSMLVLNTGGWFIAGCPLSVVAKVDVQGGIFRIRKKGAERMEDALGHTLHLQSLSAESLAEQCNDQRSAVRDNVIERLVEIGEHAVAPIRNSLLGSDNEELRAAGVFALYRINTPNALREVRTALGDPSAMVRTSAARVLGLSKDIEAVDKLIEIVQKTNIRFAGRRLRHCGRLVTTVQLGRC